MEHVTEGFIPVEGGNVWFSITGAGPGIPLLVLHGGPGGMSSEIDPLRNLGSERPVIQYDQLGCGKSGRPTDTDLWTVERYVEELEHVIEALELKEFHLLGHSWGSMLAASYLLDKQPKERHLFESCAQCADVGRGPAELLKSVSGRHPGNCCAQRMGADDGYGRVSRGDDGLLQAPYVPDRPVAGRDEKGTG